MTWLDVLSQWLHLAFAAVAVGGVIYARMVALPALGQAAEAARRTALEGLVARMRPLWFSAIGVLLVSGLYNLARSAPGKPPVYHMLVGVKILLALHVFASLFLAGLPGTGEAGSESRRGRRLVGAAISGLVILLLSAYLRRSF